MSVCGSSPDPVRMDCRALSHVEGNFIGTDPSGTVDLGNQGEGVLLGLASANNVVGGATPAARNLICGNSGHGVEISSDNNQVLGNLIGTGKDGVSPQPRRT